MGGGGGEKVPALIVTIDCNHGYSSNIATFPKYADNTLIIVLIVEGCVCLPSLYFSRFLVELHKYPVS